MDDFATIKELLREQLREGFSADITPDAISVIVVALMASGVMRVKAGGDGDDNQ